jgi:hypothetical protein
MADNHPHPDDLDLAVHHEEHDVNVIAVTKFGIGLTLIIMFSVLILWALFNYFAGRVAAELGETPAAAGLGSNAVKLPPEPRLQREPRTDLRDMRAAEDQLLTHYGWVDQAKGVVRLPIERAMDILAQKGLPARTQAPEPIGSRNNPTQSSAGPILQQPGGPLAAQVNAAEAAAQSQGKQQ